MDVEKYISDRLARRTFATPELRQKVADALRKSLNTIEAIKSIDDDYEETQTQDHIQDDGDGVSCITIADFESSQDQKRATLRTLWRGEIESDVAVLEEDSINAHGKWGYTALHFAAVEGNEAECDRLLELGADKTAVDNGGKCPWEKALLRGFDALAEKLKP